ncbi:MAG: BrnA antitoxin family protein, partial [Pseudomonadota bacterium]
MTRSKRQREAQYYMADAMRRFEWDMHNEIGMQGRIPEAWREIAARRDSPRVKVGFSCDADIVRFFKSMGPGYQRRMNDVLRAFMHARLAGLLE